MLIPWYINEAGISMEVYFYFFFYRFPLNHFPVLLRHRPPLSIESLGIFPGEQSLVFLAPIVSPGLLDLHREVHQLLQGAGAFPAPYYLPGHWTPHCALATRVPPHLVSQVVAIGRGISFPLHIRIEEIGVIAYPPVKHLFAFRLTGT